MTRSPRSRAALVAGVALSGACVALALPGPSDVIVLLAGAVVAVSAAAVAASRRERGAGGGGGLAVLGLVGGLVLAPFVAVGLLILAGADGLAVVLIGGGLFASAGVLIVVFVAVYVLRRWGTRPGRHDSSTGRISTTG